MRLRIHSIILKSPGTTTSDASGFPVESFSETPVKGYVGYSSSYETDRADSFGEMRMLVATIPHEYEVGEEMRVQVITPSYYAGEYEVAKVYGTHTHHRVFLRRYDK